MKHNVIEDRAGMGHLRLTCTEPGCNGATLVRQPYMNDAQWGQALHVFKQAHPHGGFCEKELKDALNFYGTPKTFDRDGKKGHTVEEAEDWGYNWVEIIESPDGKLIVLTHLTEPHLWADGGEVMETVNAEGLKDALYRAFKEVSWSFPTRPQNVQEWSDV